MNRTELLDLVPSKIMCAFQNMTQLLYMDVSHLKSGIPKQNVLVRFTGSKFIAKCCPLFDTAGVVGALIVYVCWDQT